MAHAQRHLPLVTLRVPADGERGPATDSEWDDWGPLPDPILAPDVGRVLVVHEGTVIGDMAWHEVHYGPNLGSRAWNIGIALATDYRGRGFGAAAQRALAEHLFATTDVDRVEASTDVDNVAEQRSLAKAGFIREGLLRGAQYRADGRHDLVVFSRLRVDP